MMKKLGYTVALVGLLAAAPAQAAPITISVSGVFDTAPANLPDGTLNLASGLLGTAYSASYTVSTNGADATVTERESGVDSLDVPIDSRSWSFFNPSMCGGHASCSPSSDAYYTYGPANNTLTTVLGSYSADVLAGVSVTNNFNYDGSQGMLSAGTYDILVFWGWMRSFASCSGVPEIEEEGCNNFAHGRNFRTEFTLIGTSDMLQDSDTYPLGGHMDLSQVRYGLFDLTGYLDGKLTGLAIQDPPLTLVNGVLVGENMSVTVPEPGTFALWSMGLGLMGLVARRRQRNHSARPAALDCAAY